MHNMDIVLLFNQMLMLFLMMLAGFCVYKKGLLTEVSCNHFSRLIVNLLNPAIIFSAVLEQGTKVPAEHLKITFMLAAAMFIVLIVLAPVLNRMLGIPEEEDKLYRLMTVFSNVGFIGIPVVSSVHGKGAVVYVAIFILIYNILIYTYGVYLLSREKAGNIRNTLSGLLNPGVFACAAALLEVVLNFPVPSFLAGTIEYLGGAAIPLSMLVTGAALATTDMKSLFLDKKLYLFSLVKLVLLPVLAGILLKQFSLPVPEPLGDVLFLMVAMPIGSIAVMLANEYGSDGAVCAKGIVITTILSIVTIPLTAAIYQRL